jgi:hypothetical protein
MSTAPITITDITDALVGELNAGIWSQTFTAAANYRPRWTAADLATLRVTVSPRSLAISPSSRGGDQREFVVDVALQQKLDSDDDEDIPGLIRLADEIVRYFVGDRLTGLTDVACIAGTNEPIYSVEHLDQLLVFTSLITLTFRTVE